MSFVKVVRDACSRDTSILAVVDGALDDSIGGREMCKMQAVLLGSTV
jgi:hypothetical protein